MNACQTERNKHLEAVPDVTQLMWVQTQWHLQRKDQLQLLQHYTCKVKPTFVIFGHEQERKMPEGKRKQGRPKITWRQTVEKEIKEMGKTWEGIKFMARDRQMWREQVAALNAC